MQKSKSGHSLFYINSQVGIILLVVYVDDIIITEYDMAGIASLKPFRHGQFHIKDLEMLKYFLVVEIMRIKSGIFSYKRKYMLDLLSETRKLATKPSQSPMAQSLHLTREGKVFKDPERYKRLVGKLNYLTVTCPIIAY